MKRVVMCAAACAMLWVSNPGIAQGQAKIFNTVKQKLAAGKQVVGGTVYSPDPEVYCAMANAGFDFIWIEMQHSPMTYAQAARLIGACPDAPAMPFIRVPDATEGDIQKATDIGALGIILPMVDSVEKVQAAVRYAMYPPKGKRSQGGGQYRRLYGADYRQTANDNIAIVAMIESPAGVEIAAQLAAIPEVDVVFAASTDIGSFSGYRQGQPQYEALITKIHDAVLKAGKKLGGPVAWKGVRNGFTFFQAPSEAILLRMGTEALLKGQADQGPRGVAPIEGDEKK